MYFHHWSIQLIIFDLTQSKPIDPPGISPQGGIQISSVGGGGGGGEEQGRVNKPNVQIFARIPLLNILDY